MPVMTLCMALVILLLSSSAVLARDLDDNAVIWLGNKFSQDIRNQGLVIQNQAIQRYLDSILFRLFPERQPELKLYVLNSRELNAISLGNGDIYINSGMLGRIENEAQLAFVLAHEAAHFLRGHVKSARLEGRRSVSPWVYRGVLTRLAFYQFKGDQEMEADEIALNRMQAAGYLPGEAYRMLQLLEDERRMSQLDNSEYLFVTSNLEDRIQQILKLLKNNKRTGVTNEALYMNNISSMLLDVLSDDLAAYRYRRVIYILGQHKRIGLWPAEAWYYLGEAYRLRNKQGDDQRAKHAYMQAIAKAPDFGLSYRALGYWYMKQGQKDLAISQFKKFMDLDDGRGKPYVKYYLEILQADGFKP